MKIIFTGTSSFTGYWFVKSLVEAGHDVVATLRRSRDGYDGLAARRVAMLEGRCRMVFACEFGGAAFMELLRGEDRWDLFCHHAADVTDYKSPDFDPVAALANNTKNLRRVLAVLAEKGCEGMLLTGSAFEPNEGAGSDGLRAFSPYGLSKGITWETVRYYAHEAGVRLAKFTIPTPFGPYEKPGFTSYLARTWLAGERACVSSPAYIRDYIQVSLLARAYVDFVSRLEKDSRLEKLNPSGYPESNAAFVARMARELRPRLEMPCEYELLRQVEFPEPRVRINTDVLDVQRLSWDERSAWDELARYYREAFCR